METDEGPDDHEDEERDPSDLESDEEQASDAPLRDYQFGLLGFFGLVTLLGVYFAVERVHHGQFALHALGGVALLVGVVIPAAGLLIWLLLAWFEDVPISKTLLALAVAAAAVLGAKQFWG